MQIKWQDKPHDAYSLKNTVRHVETVCRYSVLNLFCTDFDDLLKKSNNNVSTKKKAVLKTVETVLTICHPQLKKEKMHS